MVQHIDVDPCRIPDFVLKYSQRSPPVPREPGGSQRVNARLNAKECERKDDDDDG
jgi:hypothetical protein